MFEEIKEAKKSPFRFGQKLKLPINIIQKIRSMELDSNARLLQIIEEYLKLVDPKPTWKGIVEALKEIKLTKLADEIEAAHCLGPGIPPEPSHTAGKKTEQN